jgi:hypothetical protein
MGIAAARQNNTNFILIAAVVVFIGVKSSSKGQKL